MIRFVLYDPLFQNLFTIVSLIGIGIYLRKIEFLSYVHHQFLTTFCLNFVLPNFIFASFMQNIDKELFSNSSSILIWGVLIHTLLLLGAYFFYQTKKNISSDDKILLRNLLPMGSIPFFGMAMATSLYGSNGTLATNIYSIPFRIFLYTVCIISISGIQFTTKDLIPLLKNSSLLASLAGLFVFFTQNLTPQIIINDESFGILRIDRSIPFLFHTVELIGSILTPLIWILIGSSLTYENLSFAFNSKAAFIFALQKILLIPFIGISTYIIANKYFAFTIAPEFISPILMLLVCPPSNVLVVLSLEYKRSHQLCLACFLMSTILALLTFPLYTILLKYLLTHNII